MQVYQLTYGDSDAYEYRESEMVGLFSSEELAKERIVADALSGTAVTGATITPLVVTGEPANAEVRVPVKPLRGLAEELLNNDRTYTAAAAGTMLHNLITTLVDADRQS